MSATGDMPAFPTAADMAASFSDRRGLTKRELFAAIMLVAFAGNEYTPYNEAVRGAVDWSDALIAELAKDKS